MASPDQTKPEINRSYRASYRITEENTIECTHECLNCRAKYRHRTSGDWKKDCDSASDEHHKYCNTVLARAGWLPEEQTRRVTDNTAQQPSYYNQGGIKVWDIWDAYKLGGYECLIIKYILRAKFKNNELEDLKKAAEYLKHKIELLEKNG